MLIWSLVPGIFPEGPMISVPSIRPSVRPSVRSQRIFSKSEEPNFLKFGIQPLWDKSKRMSKPFFDFCKIRPSRAKKRPFFGPFLAIFAVFWTWKFFQRAEFFYFLIWCFWAYLEVICKNLWKKGQNSAVQGQKTAIFGPFLAIFAVFRA